jgi:Trk-type K+ transport system membrane component
LTHNPYFIVSYLYVECLCRYRALTKLIIIIPTYVFFFSFLGGIILFAYAWGEPYTAELLRSRGVNTWWFASFHVIAAFNNGGFTLFNDNLIPFIKSPGLLIIFSALIIAGNVGFPILLRIFITLFHKVASVKHKKVFRFLLDHPRLCFVYLFPTHQVRCNKMLSLFV